MLVLGGRERHALAIVRSLGRHGVEVHVADDHASCTGALSRHCRRQQVLPSAERDPHGFVDALKRILSTNEYGMVFAVTDVLPILLARHKDELSPHARILVPDWPVFERANDKAITFRIAHASGVPAPRTFVVRSLDEWRTQAPGCAFPVIVKPASKTVVREDGTVFSVKAVRAHDATALETALAMTCDGRTPFLVQEFVPGDGGYGVGALCGKGRVRATFAFRRLHEYPTTGGASTLRVGIEHPAMITAATRLLEAMEWDGVAMVEFKLDARDGRPMLIEVNGRFWGSLALAVRSGVDFPWLLYLQTLGEPLPPIEARVGVKARWLVPGDLMYLQEALRRRPHKLAVVRDFLQVRGVHDDVLSLSDPLPILGELKATLGYGIEVVRGVRSLHGELRRKR